MKLLINPEGFINKKIFILSGRLRRESEEIDFQLSKLPAKIIKNWNMTGSGIPFSEKHFKPSFNNNRPINGTFFQYPLEG